MPLLSFLLLLRNRKENNNGSSKFSFPILRSTLGHLHFNLGIMAQVKPKLLVLWSENVLAYLRQIYWFLVNWDELMHSAQMESMKHIWQCWEGKITGTESGQHKESMLKDEHWLKWKQVGKFMTNIDLSQSNQVLGFWQQEPTLSLSSVTRAPHHSPCPWARTAELRLCPSLAWDTVQARLQERNNLQSVF